MNSTCRGTLLYLLAILLPAAVQAQDQFTVENCQALFDKTIQANRSQEAPDVAQQESDRSPLGASGITPNLNTAASLSAGDESGRAFLSLATQGNGFVAPALGLKISVPFDKKKEEGVFADLGGVSGDIVFSGSMTYYRWLLDLPGYAKALCNRCDERGVTRLADCRPENSALWPNESSRPAEVDRLQQHLFGGAKMASWLWGVEGRIAHEERKYFNAEAEEENEDRLGFSFSALTGIHRTDDSVYLKLTGKQDYKNRDEVQRCTPVEDTMDLESCKQLSFGEAEEVESLLASLQYVKPLSDFIISLAAEHDFETSDWTFLLPIYLLTDEDGEWVGGVKFAWSSEDEDWGAAIFVSKPLDW